MHITACICTYQRPRLLGLLLEKLARQETDGRFTYSVVVADNDPAESARPVVEQFAQSSGVATVYCVQPEQNIALTRNAALARATGDFIAFMDDDEFAGPRWLVTMLDACEKFGAAGVLAPVRPHFETPPPAWIIRGRFCERPEHTTGTVLHWRQTRTGNCLFRRAILEGVAEPFDPRYGNGGEDQDFFRRMMERGGKFVWCNEAPVHEVVPPERWQRRYMLKRALLRGQNEKGMLTLGSLAKSLVAVVVYTLLLPVLVFSGQSVLMRFLIRLFDHLGKLLGALRFKPAGEGYLGAPNAQA
jgi:succinoglycan biosynthesis protein ExoM